MRIKIVKIENDNCWYVNKIGEIYEVCKHNRHYYEIVNNGSLILKKDCQIQFFSLNLFTRLKQKIK